MPWGVCHVGVTRSTAMQRLEASGMGSTHVGVTRVTAMQRLEASGMASGMGSTHVGRPPISPCSVWNGLGIPWYRVLFDAHSLPLVCTAPRRQTWYTAGGGGFCVSEFNSHGHVKDDPASWGSCGWRTREIHAIMCASVCVDGMEVLQCCWGRERSCELGAFHPIPDAGSGISG
jgi:hypothetical protein